MYAGKGNRREAALRIVLLALGKDAARTDWKGLSQFELEAPRQQVSLRDCWRAVTQKARVSMACHLISPSAGNGKCLGNGKRSGLLRHCPIPWDVCNARV